MPLAHPAIASLVPAATDLLLAMGAGDHLVAVSNYDVVPGRELNVPRIGDYENTDWEMLRRLRPDIMITQMSEQRVPEGLRQRAVELGIRRENVRIERLNDVYRLIARLGEIAKCPDRAAAMERRIREQLASAGRASAERASAGRAPVRVLVVISDDAQTVIGPDTFIDDVLASAGGVNAAAALGRRYPQIDREMLRSLAPEVILELLPGASEPVLAQAHRAWRNLGDVPAVRDGRVYVLTEWWVLQPGSHIGELAERFAELIHQGSGDSTTRPTP